MGYRGKLAERQRARELRAQSWTLAAIAAELGVSTSSVSEWVRDVDFVPRPRNRGHPAGPQHPMRLKKQAEIERCRAEAEAWVGALSSRDLEMFALGLYAGEGNKTKAFGMANTNPAYLLVFLTWLRTAFDIDESRLRVVLYLHEGLEPYRAIPDSSIRSAKHVFGCPAVRYSSSLLRRRVLARIAAVTSTVADPG